MKCFEHRSQYSQTEWGLVYGYGFCFLGLFVTLLIITFPIFFYLCIAHACMYGYINSIV